MGLTEFFAMEAGEYLERLDTVVSSAAGPDRDELVRLARALRGSALMANQQSIGSIAAGLESLARAVKEARVTWNQSTQQTFIRAVDGSKILVRSVATWGDAETNKAKNIAAELAAASGTPIPGLHAPPDPTVDTGTRAFVAREGAAVASVLNQAAKSVQREGPSRNQFDTVKRSMEPLWGLAALSDLSPLPEFLDGVERVVVMAMHRSPDPNDLALFLDVAARGLSQAAQQISTSGAAEPDSMEAREFTRRLAELLDVDADVVPIQSLYYEDDGPHVIEPGSRSSTQGQMGQMEFVAHGEHLCQVADGLDRAQYDTQREIRTISLKSTLRTLTAAKGSSLASAVSAFATVALEAVASGFLEQHKTDFVSRLRDAGITLGGATQAAEADLVAKLAEITETLQSLPQTAVVTSGDDFDLADGALSRPPAPSASMPLSPVVPETTPERVPEMVAEEPVDVAASWTSYEELRTRFGDGEPSIEELLGVGVAAELVSITELCYSGSAAFAEALCVRDRIRNEMTDSAWDATLIRDLIDELLDLVELGIGQT